MRKLNLSIPEPCHENWEAMTEVEKGRFCNACQKTVIDFTNMSDRQLAEFFKKPVSNLCGHFYGDQLNREIEIPKKRIPWIKYFFQITWPALVFALKASGQSKGRIKLEVNRPLILRPTIDRCNEMGKPVVNQTDKYRIEEVAKKPTLRGDTAIIDSEQPIIKDTLTHRLYEDAVIAKTPMEEVVIVGYTQGLVRRSVTGATSTTTQGKVSSSTIHPEESSAKKIHPEEFPANLVYPNPIHAGSALKVSFADMKNAHEIRVVSSAGQVLLRSKEDQGSKSIINIPSQFAAGIYFVQIVGNEKILNKEKLVLVK
jgi:hypothetical protein